jgi:hypothetical protein
MTGVGAAMAGGNPRMGRQKEDFYPTPKLVSQALLETWKPRSRTVWECACGDGAISEVIEGFGYRVVSTDLVDRGYGEAGVDFLKTTERRADCVITNPPFNLSVPFIRHAFALGVKELALVLKATYWHAAERQTLWREYQPSLIMPLLWRPDFLGLGRPTMEAMWCVWSPEGGQDAVYRPLARPVAASMQESLML